MLFISTSPCHLCPVPTPGLCPGKLSCVTLHFDALQAGRLGRNVTWSRGSALLWVLRNQGGTGPSSTPSTGSWSLVLGGLREAVAQGLGEGAGLPALLSSAQGMG